MNVNKGTIGALGIDRYAEILDLCGATNITVFEKVYTHRLPDADAVLEWMRGTAMNAYFGRLPKSMHMPFVERYREKVRGHWPSGPIFFGFRRTLFAADKPG